MPTAIGSILQSGSVRSAPLPHPGSVDRSDADSFRATLDEQVRQKPGAAADRHGDAIEDEHRSATPNPDPLDFDDQAGGASEGVRQNPEHAAHEEAGVSRDAFGEDLGEDAEGAGGADAESASFAGAIVAQRETSSAQSPASSTAVAEPLGQNAAKPAEPFNGAVKSPSALSSEAATTGATEGDTANQQQTTDADGDSTLRGNVAADLTLSGERASSNSEEAARFADRLAARIEHQSATTHTSDGRAQDAPIRLVETSPAQSADAKAALASNARTSADVLQAQSADDQASVTSVNRGLAAVVKQNGGSVTIKLVPEALGPLKIQMSIEGGRVDLRFDAANEQAREMLLRNADMLRQSLSNKGLSVDRVQVHTAPAQSESADGRGAQQRQDGQEQQHRQDAGREQSRGYSDRRGEEQGSRQSWRDRSETFTSAWRIALNTTA